MASASTDTLVSGHELINGSIPACGYALPSTEPQPSSTSNASYHKLLVRLDLTVMENEKTEELVKHAADLGGRMYLDRNNAAALYSEGDVADRCLENLMVPVRDVLVDMLKKAKSAYTVVILAQHSGTVTAVNTAESTEHTGRVDHILAAVLNEGATDPHDGFQKESVQALIQASKDKDAAAWPILADNKVGYCLAFVEEKRAGYVKPQDWMQTGFLGKTVQVGAIPNKGAKAILPQLIKYLNIYHAQHAFLTDYNNHACFTLPQGPTMATELQAAQKDAKHVIALRMSVPVQKDARWHLFYVCLQVLTDLGIYVPPK